MNGYERTMAALRGEEPDTTPVMLHNFMLAAHESRVSMGQFRQDARLAAQCFIRAVEKYRYDAILMDFDTAALAGAVGAGVDHPEDEPARVTAGCLASLQAVDDLQPVNLAGNARIQVWLETAARLVEHFGQEIAVRGNCDQAPFSLAALVRGTGDFLMDLTDVDNEPGVMRLLEFCAGVTGQFLRLMAQTGVHILSNGDSIAGPDMISPRFYKKYAFPFEKRMAAEAASCGLPYILHVCGDTTRILPELAQTGTQGLELDYKTCAQAAREALNDRVTLIGMLDPVGVLAQGTPALVQEKTLELLRLFAGTPRFILNAGCAISPLTPPENIHAMVQTARNFRR